MRLNSRLTKLENSVCSSSEKRIVSRKQFDATVERLLNACRLGKNIGIAQLTVIEAKAWAKKHIEMRPTFGGFDFDVVEIMTVE